MNTEIKKLIDDYKTLNDIKYSTIIDGKKIIDLEKEKEIKSKKSEIKKKLCDFCKQYIFDIIDISQKYELSHKFDSSINTSTGRWKIVFNDVDFDINYSDSWAYGGYTDESFNISINELIEYDKNEFIKSCIQKSIKSIETKIEFHTNQLNKHNEKLLKLKEELDV